VASPLGGPIEFPLTAFAQPGVTGPSLIGERGQRDCVADWVSRQGVKGVRFWVAVLLSAFLLFQVQPLVNKYILPWFGGTPAVWSTSTLFFQVLLTGGYAYWLAGQRSTRKQCFVHLVLLGCSALLLILLGLV
jgi:hypothetical protein